MTLVRRDVWGLQAPWDPITKAYALAVGEMAARPANEPTSWAYQAEVHGVGNPADPPPDKWRSQCQHNSSFFLPWHRWYLYYLEQMMRATIQSIVEVPADVKNSWALPYWDYSRSDSAALPPAFRERKLWDGVRDNPLWVDGRAPGINDGTGKIPSTVAVPSVGVLDQPFSSQFAAPTFGGSEFIGDHHFHEHWRTPGGLEATPHNAVHGLVGGLMLDFATAALDPIFYLHHCNIDRYWEVRGHSAPHLDPTGAWATYQFDFHDASGSPVRPAVGDAIDTMGQLGYQYENTSQPPAPQGARALRRPAMAGPSEGAELPAEVVGHSDAALTLSGATASVGLAVGPTSRQFRVSRGGRDAPERVILNVEDIRGEHNPTVSYEVYLGEQTPEHLAGILSFFGIEFTTPDSDQAHGLSYVFDVTDVVRQLSDEGSWDPANIQVSFKPVGLDYDDGLRAQQPHPEVAIGRVSFSYQ